MSWYLPEPEILFWATEEQVTVPSFAKALLRSAGEEVNRQETMRLLGCMVVCLQESGFIHIVGYLLDDLLQDRFRFQLEQAQDGGVIPDAPWHTPACCAVILHAQKDGEPQAFAHVPVPDH
jgi:hypothetical protein